MERAHSRAVVASSVGALPGGGIWAERASWWGLGACICAALALRFYAIDRLPGINGDEPQYAVHAHSFFAGAPLQSLRTGSDLPMNPVFFGSVLLIQKLLPSTLFSLRLSAVLLSVASVVLAWLLFRARGQLFALTFACLVAVLPIHLGYARFAWDPTAIPFATLLALAASANLRPVLCLAAFGLCLWVHPTTVFLLPTLLAPFVVVHFRSAQRWLFHKRWRAILALLLVLGVVPLAGWALEHDLLPGAVSSALHNDLLEHVRQRALAPRGLLEFFRAYAELLSGPTIYRYIAGSLSQRAASAHAWASAAVALPLLAAGVHGILRRGRRVDLAVVLGLAVSVLVEYLLAGPVVLAPKTERYAVCLSVPACYVLSACLDALATSRSRARLLRAAVSCMAAALLWSFCQFYLRPLHHADPQRENTFRTGAVEPKAQALQVISARREPGKTALVYVEDWWIYWTLRYLAPPERGVRVTIYRHPWDYRFPQDFVPPDYDPQRMQLFGVAWAGHALDKSFATVAQEQLDVHGYEPGPILRVHTLRALPERKRGKRR